MNFKKLDTQQRKHNAQCGLRRLSTTAIAALCILLPSPVIADAQNFSTYHPHPSGIEISNARSGVVCMVDGEPDHVCRAAYTIPITGDTLCEWSEDVDYPCTYYGYEFDLANVTEETEMVCEVANSIHTVFGPGSEVTGSNTARYTETIEAGQKKLFHPAYHTYAPVEQETAVVSIHACKVGGVPLFQASFRAHYTPE